MTAVRGLARPFESLGPGLTGRGTVGRRRNHRRRGDQHLAPSARPSLARPILLVTRRHEAAPATLGGAILLYAIGVVLMVASDAQSTPASDQKGPITDGLFARTRNPNYLGEMT
jgi:hypothetical protein